MKLLIAMLLMSGGSAFSAVLGNDERVCGTEVFSIEIRGETVLCADIIEIKESLFPEIVRRHPELDGKVALARISKSMKSSPRLDYLLNDDTKVLPNEDLDKVCSYFGFGKHVYFEIEKAKFWVRGKESLVFKKAKYVAAVVCIK